MNQCPQDGGFIGACGCTHPNHQHSALVKRLLSMSEPMKISVTDANSALNEGFYVDSSDGRRIGFGWNLKGHIDSHGIIEGVTRKEHLAYAIDTVKSGTVVRDRRIAERVNYVKSYGNFGILAVANNEGRIDDVVTYFKTRTRG